jgi:hypothetical protein
MGKGEPFARHQIWFFGGVYFTLKAILGAAKAAAGSMSAIHVQTSILTSLPIVLLLVSEHTYRVYFVCRHFLLVWPWDRPSLQEKQLFSAYRLLTGTRRDLSGRAPYLE